LLSKYYVYSAVVRQQSVCRRAAALSQSYNSLYYTLTRPAARFPTKASVGIPVSTTAQPLDFLSREVKRFVCFHVSIQ